MEFGNLFPEDMHEPIKGLTGSDVEAPFKTYSYAEFHCEIDRVIEKAQALNLIPPTGNDDASQARGYKLGQIIDAHEALCTIRDQINELKPQRAQG